MAGEDGTAPRDLEPDAGQRRPDAAEEEQPDAAGQGGAALMSALREKPYAFDFFQALRRIECAYPDKMRLGEAARTADEPIRLGQEPSLAFAPSTLASFTPGDDGHAPRLSVFFFGLFGPNGALPTHLTEFARDRMRNSGDYAFSRFMDVFHNRMLGLFYRAWANAQPTVNLDRPEKDRFATYVGSLSGIGMPSLRHRDAMPDLAKLYFAGRMSCQTRHAEGLRAIVASFFRVPVEIQEFVADWLELPENSRWRLGESRETGTLGLTTTVGERIWSCHHKFRIMLGPIDLAAYRRLLPGRGVLPLLVAIVRNYVGDELSWDAKIVLRKEDVPDLRLDGTAQLGWTTWVAGGRRDRDADDLLLNPMAYAV